MSRKRGEGERGRDGRQALREPKPGRIGQGNRYRKFQSGGLQGLTVYDPAEAPKRGKVGILAETSYSRYTILFGKRLIQGTAETGEQKSALNQLAVGDNVVFELSGRDPTVLGIVARRSRLARLRASDSGAAMQGAREHVIAANIDIAVIVASVSRPAFRPGLVDRYMVICQYGNVKPLLCMTKMDLAPLPDLSAYRDTDLPIVAVSNKTGEGIDGLLSLLKGKCCVFVGHSGVGKSSLINSIIGNRDIEVGNVGAKTGRGKHTTSTTSLHVIGGSTFLIDTPGIRSLGLWNIDAGSLRLYFPEFQGFAGGCEFKDCSHSHEPKCAVKEAVRRGEITEGRYDAYIRLLTKR